MSRFQEDPMLVLSENATMAIRNVVDRPELPDASGIRISGEQSESAHLNISMAETPEEGDQVVESGGARVFLEPSAATMLDDKVLDATVDEKGRIAFVLGSQ